MMRIYQISLLLFVNYVSCQNVEIQDFINKISSEIVPRNFEHYNLVDLSLQGQGKVISLQNYEKRDLLKSYPSFPFALLEDKSTEIVNWKNFNLENAILNSKEYLEKKTSQISVTKQNSDTTSLESKMYFAFGIPEFTKDRNYCRIIVYKSYGDDGVGTMFIFKLVKSKWINIFERDIWATKRTFSH